MERDMMTRDETEEHQEDLGDVEPKVDTKEDQLIQSQIQDYIDNETKDNKEDLSELSKKNPELGKTRYEQNFEHDDKEAFQLNEYYDEDFDIEDPNDVNVEICRGVQAQKQSINKSDKRQDEQQAKILEDQGGSTLDNESFEKHLKIINDRAKQLQERLANQLAEDFEENPKVVKSSKSSIKSKANIDISQQKNDRSIDIKESPVITPSKFQPNKFTSAYKQNSDHLDGSTVVIADVTPSQEEISRSVPPSPMLDKTTKEKLKMLGQSLDSKHINQAIGSIDIRRLLKCFSKAICKHIEFSEGFLFLEDLKFITKEIYREHGIPEEESVKFSYGLGKGMNICLPNQVPLDPETKEKMKKDGEIKKNQNFEKITGIFGESTSQKDQQKKEGKVFEYQIKDETNASDEEIEYSQAHLEEFMKSLNAHNKNKGFKQDQLEESEHDTRGIGDSTLNPEQTNCLISTFLNNVNHNSNLNPQTCSKDKVQVVNKRSESQIISGNFDVILGTHTGATLSNSLAYSQTNASVKGYNQFNSVNLVSGLKSRRNQEESKLEEEKYSTNLQDNQLPIQPYKLPDDEENKSEEEDLDREEDFYIEVDTPVTQKSAKVGQGNPSAKKDDQYEIEQIERMKILNQDLESNDHQSLMEQTNLYESQEVFLDPKSKETFKDYIEAQMYLFHFNFNFEIDGMMLDENSDIPSFPFLQYKPTEEEVYYYCKYVVLASKMEKEIPLMALVYIERFMTSTGMLLNHWNWRRIVLIVLIIASKVWDDDSLENIHFPQVMPDITLKEVNTLEKIFLELIDYKLHIRGAEYAKYYFILQTIANEFRNGELEIPKEDYPLDVTM